MGYTHSEHTCLVDPAEVHVSKIPAVQAVVHSEVEEQTARDHHHGRLRDDMIPFPARHAVGVQVGNLRLTLCPFVCHLVAQQADVARVAKQIAGRRRRHH
jgi:hypothetical protein